MRLKSVGFYEFPDRPRRWAISPPLLLGSVNLIVGKNASGKSRTMNLISSLARMLAGDLKPEMTSSNHDAAFEHQDQEVRYTLNLVEKKVVTEKLVIGDRIMVDRGPGGVGKIWAEKLASQMDFQTPEDQLACVAKRDAIQHPFLEFLYQWATSVLHYEFGTPLGKGHFAVLRPDVKQTDDRQLRDPDRVVAVFRKGDKRFPGEYREAIKADMRRIGYELSDVDTATPEDIIAHAAPGPLHALRVMEQDREVWTEQPYMSQGMFRALSLIVHSTYFRLTGASSCILVDDIGEGLDFERSSGLIKVLAERSRGTNQQLIMTTNDRFVMNSIPLEEWTVLRRNGGEVRVYNYANSKKAFDRFKFTGLNNFDFLATDFVSEGTSTQ